MNDSRRQFLCDSGRVAMALSISTASMTALSSAALIPASTLPADITDLSASQLSAAIKLRQVSCLEVMEAYLARINQYNDVYNSIVGMPDTSGLLEQSRAADRALEKGEYWGWMHGMPHAAKDLTDVRGLINSRGSAVYADNVSSSDGICVERIRGQGAIFIGKTNVPEFGLGSQSYNNVYGTTRNAYLPQLCAGGSSGGAASALATHLLPVADGSDMMGSLRNPAAYNNVVGFRPSRGRVPHKGGDLFYQQLGYQGPMGRCVEDTIRMLGTMSGYDARDPLSLRDQVSSFEDTVAKELKQYTLGWMGDYEGYLPTEPGVTELCEKALSQLASNGAVVEKCQPDYDMSRLWQTWLTLRHWTVSGGPIKSLYDAPDTKKLLKPEAVWEVEGGLELTGADLSGAAVARSDWYRAVNKLFQKYDFLVLPTAQVFPFAAETHWPEKIGNVKMDTYHRWMEVVIGGTLSGCPVVNLPAGFDAKGRPMGLQFIGPKGEDSKVLEFALAYEASTDYLAVRPKMRDSL